ncbi:MAG: hypothetical protein P4L50_18155 [Anaerolineaceae bacterium]|nr:hypothetical protein [Anaerolineaceae bacterium]
MSQIDAGQETHSLKLEKTPTGIRGLDKIVNGGLPKGRPTLVCGGYRKPSASSLA